MRGIFISYRRDDSAGYAGRLFDVLRERLGEDRVFMDVADIEPGADFVQTLARGLQESDAVLVLIGPRWTNATTVEGRLRLWEPDDFVRKEIVTALASGRRVVPLLVQGAAMPRAEQLPAELQGLLTRQAVVLSDARWQRDCEDLLADLYPQRGAVPARPVPEPAPVRRSAQWKVLLALLVVGAAVVGGVAADRAGFIPPVLPWSQVTVPNVIGLQRAEAEHTLQAAGLAPGDAAQARDAREPRGTVVAQRPAGGERLARGGSVALTVSARPADTLVEVPNLTLSTLDEARVALARRGLKLGRVDARNAPQARPGLVLEQSVQPAGRVATGTPVNVVVAAAPAAGGVAQQDGKAGKAGKPATQPAGTLAQDSWVAQAGEPVRVTVDALCGKRVLLAYQRCVERECAKAVHADDPLCRTQPPAATGGN